jgi:hypothetical protein
LSSFSQTDTKIKQVPNNDTIKLHKDLANKIAKDLIYLDAIVQEKTVLLENIDSLNNQKKYKDSIILNKDKQIRSYKDIIDINSLKEAQYRATVTAVKYELKKQKLSNKITFGLLALAVGLIIIK